MVARIDTSKSSRSASSPKVEEKTLLLFSSSSMTRRDFSISIRHLKPISLAEDLRKALKPKKIGTLNANGITKHPIKHASLILPLPLKILHE